MVRFWHEDPKVQELYGFMAISLPAHPALLKSAIQRQYVYFT